MVLRSFEGEVAAYQAFLGKVWNGKSGAKFPEKLLGGIWNGQELEIPYNYF